MDDIGSPTTMMAYIDPSSGGLLIQLILAGFAGIGVLIKAYFNRIRNLSKKPKKDSDQSCP